MFRRLYIMFTFDLACSTHRESFARRTSFARQGALQAQCVEICVSTKDIWTTSYWSSLSGRMGRTSLDYYVIVRVEQAFQSFKASHHMSS